MTPKITVYAVRAAHCFFVSGRFILGATEFDNFYVAPMCSQTRAALLTGRDFARTGTMLINGGGHSSTPAAAAATAQTGKILLQQ
jgi:arylsulfatase A-like enzyme